MDDPLDPSFSSSEAFVELLLGVLALSARIEDVLRCEVEEDAPLLLEREDPVLDAALGALMWAQTSRRLLMGIAPPVGPGPPQPAPPTFRELLR